MSGFYSHDKWTRIRERGYLRFLIFRSIPIYGLPIIFGSRLVRDFYNATFNDIPLDWGKFFSMLPELLVLGILLGILFGTFDYSRMERLYYKEERESEKANSSGEIQDLI
ncbi:MAG: hypothetical protein VX764_00045 [Planctomycetota bacterium]|nr:hypothetical protein [Planctomycetota bacterium]